MFKELAALVALLFSCAALAATPQAPAVGARAWILVDVTSGQRLAGGNTEERIEPASLTKLMSAYLVFSALKQNRLSLSQTVPVSERAWHASGSRMFIEPHKPVSVEELLRGLIVLSGNDAGIALAEVMAGSEAAFVELMNKEASRLGMKITHFTNASGLPDAEHYSSAGDLALLSAALLNDFPEYYRFYSEREYRYNNITQQNRNRLLWLDPNVDGIKTGHTHSAGYCLIASSKRGLRRLLSVVVGAASDGARARESQKILNFGYQAWDGVRLYEKNQPVGQLEVWKGSVMKLRAGLAADLFVTVPRGEADKLKVELVSRQPLLAPLAAGQRVATLRVLLDGAPLREYPVVALENVAVAGVLGRTWDSVRLWFK